MSWLAETIGRIGNLIFYERRKIPKPLPMQIVDISKWNWNKPIDFTKLSLFADKCFIRAGNGLAKQDPYFLPSAKGCVANGIQWGSYFFAQFQQDALAQATKFVAIVEQALVKPSLPLVLDVETNETKLPITSKQLEAFCHKFLEYVESKGYDTAIYMSPGFSWFLPKGHTLGKYKLWAADSTGIINPVNGWPKPWMHQWTDKGSVPGITGNVDLNRFVE